MTEQLSYSKEAIKTAIANQKEQCSKMTYFTWDDPNLFILVSATLTLVGTVVSAAAMDTRTFRNHALILGACLFTEVCALTVLGFRGRFLGEKQRKIDLQGLTNLDTAVNQLWQGKEEKETLEIDLKSFCSQSLSKGLCKHFIRGLVADAQTRRTVKKYYPDLAWRNNS